MSYVGGYYMIKEPFLKYGLHEHTASLRRPISDEVMYVCDALGKTPLEINGFVFDVVQELVDRNETLGSIPPSGDIPMPPTIPDHVWEGMTVKDKMGVKADREAVWNSRAKYQGQREALYRKINMAHDLKGETFWIPHCPDFRGRLYPQSQDLNFVNDDLSRGLIRFAEGKQLGPRGKHWLSIRLANTYGMDKFSFAKRVQWVINNDTLILDSARNPLDGQRFWADADEPYQFLAACKEYEGYVMQGETFVSHIPIHLDATASGLQHLSAWSRDARAAQVVNMTGSDERYDIYGIQAEALNTLISRDMETSAAALNCHGYVTRATVKRGVMTIPYSVTPQGLRDQFIKDGHLDNIPGSKIQNANYLRDALMESLGDTIEKPMEVMAYFKGCVEALANENIPLEFTTPMGMRVRQAYINHNKKEVKTLFGKAVLWYEEKSLGLNKRKQSLASSPNIIHAHDAAHLQAVVMMGASEDNPITSWACIHDSIGVHACEVDRLNKIIRREFVRIYDRPILEEFHTNLKRHKVKLPDPPTLGSFDINSVEQAPYFFS